MADNVAHISSAKPTLSAVSGGEPPDMEQRLRNLETDVAIIKSNYATKADIESLRAEIVSASLRNIRWSVGTFIAAMAVIFTALPWLSSFLSAHPYSG